MQTKPAFIPVSNNMMPQGKSFQKSRNTFMFSWAHRAWENPPDQNLQQYPQPLLWQQLQQYLHRDRWLWRFTRNNAWGGEYMLYRASSTQVLTFIITYSYYQLILDCIAWNDPYVEYIKCLIFFFIIKLKTIKMINHLNKYINYNVLN